MMVPIHALQWYRFADTVSYIFKHSTEPIQKWVECGVFSTSVTLINTNHGVIENITTKVTGKGQQYFLNLFLNKTNN